MSTKRRGREGSRRGPAAARSRCPPGLCLAFVGLLFPFPALGQARAYLEPGDTASNRSAEASPIEIPADFMPVLADLFVNGEPRGSAEFYISAQGRLFFASAFIRQALSGIALPGKIAGIASRDRLVATDELGFVGIRVSFDPESLALGLDIAPGSMIQAELASRELEGKGAKSPPTGLVLRPEPLSAVLGLSLAFDPGYRVGPSGEEFSLWTSLGLRPSVYLLGFVAEAELELSYSESFAARLYKAELLRDFPSMGARLRGGIVGTPTRGFQSSAELLGFTLSRETNLGVERKPLRSVIQELLIDRNASVSIEVNGSLVRKYRLPPGSYRLSDLPLSSGFNEILVRIEEEGKSPRLLSFGLPFDAGILGPGELDYAVSAGFDRESLSRPFWSAYVSAGLGPFLELGLDAEAGFGSFLGGLSAAYASPIGNFGASGALSSPFSGDWTFQPSLAARVSWQLPMPARNLAPRLGFSAEHRAAGFGAPDREGLQESASALPAWFLGGQLGQSLPGNRGNLSLFAEAEFSAGTFVDLSLSLGFFLPLPELVSLSLAAGGDWSAARGFEPELSISISATTPERRSMRYSQDLKMRSNSFDIALPLELGNRSSLAIRADNLALAGEAQTLSLGGRSQGRYLAIAASSSFRRDLAAETRQVDGAFSASTALGFAGGRVAAATSFGNSFAILLPDESLKGERVELRPYNGTAIASTRGEPALVSGLGPYTPFSATIELPASAPDRRPEPAAVSFTPAFRSITLIPVRAAPSIALRGRLVDEAGRPRPNFIGDLLDAEGNIRPLSGTFTDEDGVFECYDLGEGEQAILWGDGGILRFAIAAGEKRKLVELGNVRAFPPAATGGGSR